MLIVHLSKKWEIIKPFHINSAAKQETHALKCCVIVPTAQSSRTFLDIRDKILAGF